MRKIIFIQCFLCIILVFFCILTEQRKSYRTVEAGAFGTKKHYNDTLEDVTNNIYDKLFDE